MKNNYNLEKRFKNLLRKLLVDESSILFASGDDLNQKTVKRLRKSAYGKDKILFNLYNEFISNNSNENILKEQLLIPPLYKSKRVIREAICCIV